jgi:hypothetical protein
MVASTTSASRAGGARDLVAGDRLVGRGGQVVAADRGDVPDARLLRVGEQAQHGGALRVGALQQREDVADQRGPEAVLGDRFGV